MNRKQKMEREILSREGLVTRWEVDVNATTVHVQPETNTRRESVYLEIFGDFTVPVNGISQFKILMMPGDLSIGLAEIPCVGSFLKAKPALEGVVRLSLTEFQTVLSLATSGNLKSCSCDFQAPRYGSGLITTMMLSSELPPRS